MKKTISALALTLIFGAVFAAGYPDGKTAMKSARQLEKENKKTEAVEAYRAAAKLCKKPNEQVDALTRAARLLTAQKKSPEALKILTEFAENTKNPASQRTMAYLECARAASGQAEKIKYLDTGLSLKAGDWTEGACTLQKAEILLRQKKTDEAEAAYILVAENTRYNEITRASACSGLAKIALAKKNYAAAHDYCGKIRAMGSRYAFLIVDAGMQEADIYKTEKKWDDAVRVYAELAANQKVSKRNRTNAIEMIVVLEFENRNNPDNAKKALELFKKYNLPMTAKAKKYEKDIKELTE